MKRYRIPEMAEKYMKYDMIQSFTELPPLSEPRLRMLHAALDSQQSTAKHSELFTLVTSLVQVGLDTHDLIDTDDQRRSEREMRSRQLNVLAGDYFSSRFYQLLAQAGQVEMIARISGAVSEVNRLKVTLYAKMRSLKVTAEDYYSYAVRLKSGLFEHFAGLLEGSVSRLWPELLSELSRCEVALDEMKRTESCERFQSSWGYWHIIQVGTDEERYKLTNASMENRYLQGLVEKYGIHSQLLQVLKQSAGAVKAIVNRMESDNLVEEMSRIVDHMLHSLGGHVPALNETR
ncbi:heptaprenyl diphosphate synthase component 1 [Paenibacillus sp. J5C_2022]|uniref:heptaprenyl diphosphate synthase component 1 n=1 Tax=Paenibacillus sp. J5C2022 TaxID=2977129 RepID=UPI0021CFE3F7|nr:heptaprenyl diphosphate synthase component 1 [Paenibacillus sp. J5C2022]MCU6708362.1 heptaprenyl diphosphate synthase component 1 [Paenibacillus sp. J5C2022]